MANYSQQFLGLLQVWVVDKVKEQVCYQSFVTTSLDIEDCNRLFDCEMHKVHVTRIRTRVCTVIYHKANSATYLGIEF
jgi:hypothetical protein